MDYRFNQFEKGAGLTPVGYEDIKHVTYSASEQERIVYNRKRVITGTPGEIKMKLAKFARDYEVDEIIAVTITEDFQDRLNSYKLLAKIFLCEED